MSERLRQAYQRTWERELRRRVNNLPSNRKHLATMRAAGREFRRRHPELYEGKEEKESKQEREEQHEQERVLPLKEVFSNG